MKNEYFETVKEQSDRLNRDGWPNSYWGDSEDWLIVYGRHRDSDLLQNCNWDCFIEILENIDPDCYRIESANHWAVGWVESLLVDPSNDLAVREAESVHCALSDYPVLDEQAYSEAETEAAIGDWDSYGRSDYISALSAKLGDRYNLIDLLDSADTEVIDTYVWNMPLSWTSEQDSGGTYFNVRDMVNETTATLFRELR